MELISDVIQAGDRTIEQFAYASRKSFEDALRQAGRGAIRYVIAITPPASASGMEGGLDSASEAKARGMRTITRDLNRIFAPVKLKGKRRELISGADMVQIHLRHLRNKRPGAPMKRDRSQPYYVDRRKFSDLELKLRAHVGKLAAGWLAAAQALGVSAPQWISRQGASRGTFRTIMEGDIMQLESVNLVSQYAPADELRRRVPYAVEYAMNDLRRQMPHLIARNGQSLGLQTSVAG